MACIEERFSLGGAAHERSREGSAVEDRAGERKTYWANPPPPQPGPSPGDAETDAGRERPVARCTTNAGVARTLLLWALFV